MEEEMIYCYKAPSIATYFVRLICFVSIIFIMPTFHLNQLFFSIILIIALFGLFYSSTKKIELFNDSIKFSTKRLIPFFNSEYVLNYKDIKKLDFNVGGINYITMILPGSGSIKSSELVVYLFNGVVKREQLFGNNAKLNEMIKIIKDSTHLTRTSTFGTRTK